MNVEMQAKLCIGALLYLCLFDLLRRRQEDCGVLVKDGCAFVFMQSLFSILTLYLCFFVAFSVVQKKEGVAL